MEIIPDKDYPNKDFCFFGCGRSLQSLIDQQVGLMNVNTVPMNVGGTISSINRKALKNNQLDTIEIYGNSMWQVN